MNSKSCLVLAMVAGAACSALANDDQRDASAMLRPVTVPIRHITIDPTTGEKSFGAPRTGSPLLWDAYSVTTGFYVLQEPSAVANSSCGAQPGNVWLNSGDLFSGSVVDGVQVGYCAIGVSATDMVVAWWTQWSERRDLTDPTATPPAFAAGFILGSVPGGPTYCWILTLDLKNTTFAFTLSGTNEGGVRDCDYSCPPDNIPEADPRNDMDWGWGVQWLPLGPVGAGGIGPLVTDGSPAGSNAPGSSATWSPYDDFDGVEGMANCGYDYWFACAPWGDFYLGLFGTEGGTGCGSDCDGDGECDEDEVDCDGNGTPDDCEELADCNNNGIPDDCDPNHCACDVNGDGNLTVFDFLGYQTLFGNDDPCADFTGEGTLNVFDFLAFQTCFGDGC